MQAILSLFKGCNVVAERAASLVFYEHVVMYKHPEHGKMGRVQLNTLQHGNLTVLREFLLDQFDIQPKDRWVFTLKYSKTGLGTPGVLLFEPLKDTNLSRLIMDSNTEFVFTYEPPAE